MGVKRPYYLASKGPLPEGVYIRSGAASVPASDSAIIRMIRECEGDVFEARLSMNQDLTFRYAQAEFAKRGLPFESGEMRTLGMLNPDGAFTSLGLLLSDQCPPTVKAAAFSDDGRSVFTERCEYEGSILKQLSDAYAFLEAHNHYRTEFIGLERIDHNDYPAVALREALVNSVAHREYALSGPTLVSVMPSAVEIVSLGGCRWASNTKAFPLGSPCRATVRSPTCCSAWSLSRHTGPASAGCAKAMRGEGLFPEIAVTANTFSIVLPNRNAPDARVPEPAGSLPEAAMRSLSDGARTRAEVQGDLGVSQSTAVRILADLVSSGRVTRVGSGRGTRYRLS